MAWAAMPAPALDAAAEAGVLFYRMGPEVARLVTSWQTSVEEVVEAAAIFRDAVTRAG
jgi:threonine aldolase